MFLDHHFFDLPERQFLFIDVDQNSEKLQLHTIQIQDAAAATARTFGIGEYNGKAETIPDDFAVIERELTAIRETAIKKDHPCGFAAPVHTNH